jgi:hypothetical protein
MDSTIGGRMAEWLKKKKKKYLQPCLDQWCHFTPFVVSVDGLVGNDAMTVIKTLTEDQAQNTDKLYSHLCGFLWARLSIVIVRASHMCLQGYRVPISHMSTRGPQWDDVACIGLLK